MLWMNSADIMISDKAMQIEVVRDLLTELCDVKLPAGIHQVRFSYRLLRKNDERAPQQVS